MHGPSQAAFEICQAGRADVQVNPHSVGSDFEFFVVALRGVLWLKKRFGYVAVPKVIAPTVGIRVLKNEKVTISAHEPEVHIGS